MVILSQIKMLIDNKLSKGMKCGGFCRKWNGHQSTSDNIWLNITCDKGLLHPGMSHFSFRSAERVDGHRVRFSTEYQELRNIK